jgi:hypothetical protein
MLLAALVTGMLVEIPGRLVLWRVKARRTALSVFPGAFGGELRDALLHDFVDPKTRVRYDYDMFLGWRARPWQRGVTYQLDADGHRTNGNTIRDDAARVFLTGGSAAWSVGASDDTQTITATMERVLNGQGPAGPGIHIMVSMMHTQFSSGGIRIDSGRTVIFPHCCAMRLGSTRGRY